jgi:hypothetical protein
LPSIRFTQLSAGEFSALERLALKGCTITDLDRMIMRCPRLRVLTVTIGRYLQKVIVHSVSLEELELDFQTDMKCRSIRIVTPLLRQLKLKVHGNHNMDVYISAPVLEQVSWCRSYTTLPLIFGFWWLQTLRLETRESCADRDELIINHEECVHSQLPRVHVLSMEISPFVRSL